ncbi:MAG: hypothetical protein AB9861_00385 [Methanosarcina sp.]|jgi:hypothetical protein
MIDCEVTVLKKYIEEALRILDEAFDHPEYYGDLSMPTLRKGAVTLLFECQQAIAEGQSAHGEDADSCYWLGVLGRYLGEKHETFLRYMRKALDCDPCYIEAQIALREDEDYGDPYHYPEYADLRTGKARFKDKVALSTKRTLGIDLIRYGHTIMPAITIKYETHLIRSSINDRTEVKVMISIDAVPPSMPAMMHVLPIVFDDPCEPLYMSSYLNLMPVKKLLAPHVELRQFDYLPYLGRDQALRLCLLPQCALFVLDMDNRVLMSQLVCPTSAEDVPREEMARVLYILNCTEIDYVLWKMSIDLHHQCFVRRIRNPSNQVILVPAGRSLEVAERRIFPVMTKGDRLIFRGN